MRGDLSMVLVWTALTLLAPAICVAEDRGRVYAGGLAGVSTLSADARSVISADGFATSLYKPENGLAANLLIGAHLHDYVTIQASYIWNRNALTLVSARAIGDTSAFYEQHRNSSQHAVVGDLLVYFRARGKRVRPYLSVGGGIVRFVSASDRDAIARGAVPPEQEFTELRATLRVAVGLDVRTGPKWSIRYSFSESLSGNPISEQLSPPGQRNLANFQNLVGVIRTF